MPKQRFDAEVPDGMRLGFAYGAEGGTRGLLCDEKTDKLIGQAVFFEVEDDDDDDWWTSTHQGRPDTQRQRDEERDQLIADIAGTLAFLVVAMPQRQAMVAGQGGSGLQIDADEGQVEVEANNRVQDD